MNSLSIKQILNNILKDINAIIELSNKNNSENVLLNEELLNSIKNNMDKFNFVIQDLDKSDKSVGLDLFHLEYLNSRLSNTLFNKENIKKELSKKEIENINIIVADLKSVINSLNKSKIKTISDPFDKVMSDLKSVSDLLKKINNSEFQLEELIRVISTYESIINTISIVKYQMNNEDYEKFSKYLKLNLFDLKNSLKNMIVDRISNIEDEKVKENLKKDIETNNYTSVLNSKELKKVIGYDETNTIIELNDTIDLLDEIIKENETKKKDNNIDISVEDMPIFPKEKNPYEDDIEVDEFVNIPYEESRKKDIQQHKNVDKYLERFEILKKRLKEKGKYTSLSVKELSLYNKLESELINLKRKRTKKIRFKVRIYFNKLEKKLKLNKDNYYKYLVKKQSKTK